jgi:hypothetical protein
VHALKDIYVCGPMAEMDPSALKISAVYLSPHQPEFWHLMQPEIDLWGKLRAHFASIGLVGQAVHGSGADPELPSRFSHILAYTSSRPLNTDMKSRFSSEGSVAASSLDDGFASAVSWGSHS